MSPPDPALEQPGRSETREEDWLDAVARIVAVVERSDVAELELENGEFSVRLRRQVAAPPNVATVVAPEPHEPAQAAHLHHVVAPLTGIFYQSPSPSAKPYVSEGDWVDADTVVGLVETMKIFNEVTADRAGRVEAYLAQSGQLVHAGDPLLGLEPGERASAAPELAS